MNNSPTSFAVVANHVQESLDRVNTMIATARSFQKTVCRGKEKHYWEERIFAGVKVRTHLERALEACRDSNGLLVESELALAGSLFHKEK